MPISACPSRLSDCLLPLSQPSLPSCLHLHLTLPPCLPSASRGQTAAAQLSAPVPFPAPATVHHISHPILPFPALATSAPTPPFPGMTCCMATLLLHHPPLLLHQHCTQALCHLPHVTTPSIGTAPPLIHTAIATSEAASSALRRSSSPSACNTHTDDTHQTHPANSLASVPWLALVKNRPSTQKDGQTDRCTHTHTHNHAHHDHMSEQLTHIYIPTYIPSHVHMHVPTCLHSCLHTHHM